MVKKPETPGRIRPLKTGNIPLLYLLDLTVKSYRRGLLLQITSYKRLPIQITKLESLGQVPTKHVRKVPDNLNPFSRVLPSFPRSFRVGGWANKKLLKPNKSSFATFVILEQHLDL